jgi:hypothetical protein
MLNIRSIIRTGYLTIAAMLAIAAFPATTLAADSSECIPPEVTQPGVHWPNGADAGTFTYQCDGAYAGQWLSPYYVYNPDTQTETPLYSPDYAYDCGSGQWTKTVWTYSPARGTFYSSRVMTGDPGLPNGCPVPDPPADQTTQAASLNGPVGGGSGGDNTINNTGGNNLTLDNTTQASIQNLLSGTATTGDAIVIGNTLAGSAGSGDASQLMNIVNMLQSTSNALGTDSNLVVFTADINGDVNGDLLLDPSMISNVQPASTNTVNNNLNNNLTVNNATDANINNTIGLNTTSGDATVSTNTTAGDATTGNAKNIINLVNMINSAIMAGKSFLGVVNINGNLNGDILLPPDFVDQLVAANVPQITLTAPSSTNTNNTNVTNNTTVTNTNNLGITNDVNANATSGAATVSKNTSGGNASSGSAGNSITAFNLTGSSVVGSNDLLVFVNVLGKWVGLIVNAPAGATAAELGSGIVSAGPNSTNTVNNDISNNAALNNTNNFGIANTINANATSGDATVYKNTHGGNATSGDASNAINLLNVENSTLSLSNWFGILFINVFGTWHGSFGVNTSAGDPVITPDGTSIFSASAGFGNQAPPVFKFVPSSSGNGGSFAFAGGGSGSGDSSNSTNGSVLAAKTHAGSLAAPALPSVGHNSQKAITYAIAGAVVFFILGDAYWSRRHSQHV